VSGDCEGRPRGGAPPALPRATPALRRRSVGWVQGPWGEGQPGVWSGRSVPKEGGLPGPPPLKKVNKGKGVRSSTPGGGGSGWSCSRKISPLGGHRSALLRRSQQNRNQDRNQEPRRIPGIQPWVVPDHPRVKGGSRPIPQGAGLVWYLSLGARWVGVGVARDTIPPPPLHPPRSLGG